MTRFILFCACLVVLPSLASAQSFPKDQLLNAFKQERALLNGIKAPAKTATTEDMLKYARTITPNELEAHLGYIASDELEGRETAERGQKLAAGYLKAQFHKMGLKPGNGDSWYQEYELTRTRVSSVEVSFDGKNWEEFQKGFIFFNKSSFTQSLESEVVFAGYGIQTESYDNLNGLNLKGKTAIVINGGPQKDGSPIMDENGEAYSQGDKMEALTNAGAVAVINVVSNGEYDAYKVNPWLSHMMESASLGLTYRFKPSIPSIMIPERTFEAWVKKSKTNLESLKADLTSSPEVPSLKLSKYGFDLKVDAQQEVVIAENVLGFLEGTDKKDEVVVITAHYDHLGIRDGVVFNGADDDGTGTVAILEIAEAFVKATEAGFRPRRSILFMPVSGEEKGLLGSRYYSDHPIYPIANTVCNLNVDMIGRTDDRHEAPNYIYIIGSDMLSSELHTANEMANEALAEVDLDYSYNTKDDPNRYYYRSDHYNFARLDVPCIFYFSGVHPDYHKSTDTIEKIDFKKAAQVSRLIFGTAWEVANRDKRLVVDNAETDK